MNLSLSNWCDEKALVGWRTTTASRPKDAAVLTPPESGDVPRGPRRD